MQLFFVPSSFLFLVVMPGATSSFLLRRPKRVRLALRRSNRSQFPARSEPQAREKEALDGTTMILCLVWPEEGAAEEGDV